jgi:hypothetical protein
MGQAKAVAGGCRAGDDDAGCAKDDHYGATPADHDRFLGPGHHLDHEGAGDLDVHQFLHFELIDDRAGLDHHVYEQAIGEKARPLWPGPSRWALVV